MTNDVNIGTASADIGMLLHLPEVPHLSQVLHIHIVTAVGHNHLRALPCQGIYNVAAQKPRTSKYCCCDPADLHHATT